MSGKRLKVTIRADGTVSIDAHGYAGPDCAKATAAFERALGVVEKDTRGPDYFRTAAQVATVKS